MADNVDVKDLANLLQGAEHQPVFYHAVKAVHDRMFGAHSGPYNVDSVAVFATTMECYFYAREHMREKPRFDGRDALLEYALDQVVLEGLALEFGVYSGHTINITAAKLHNQLIHGFDSFKGLPEDWTPGAPAKTFAREGLPDVRNNVNLVVGWFDESLRPFLKEHPGNVSFLHVDCDLYSSTKTVFTELAGRIVPGTIIVFDEYFNYPDWNRHEYLAFQEFVTMHGIKYEYIGLVPAFQQVAVRILG